MIKMKKFHQSCFFLESEWGIKIIFDVGYLENFSAIEEAKPDICFISHKHKDHFDYSKLQAVPVIVAPDDVIREIPNDNQSRKFIIKPNESFSYGDTIVTAKPVNHGNISSYSINLGYVIDISKNIKFFYMGDSKMPTQIPIGTTHLILPVGGRKVFTPEEAYHFISINNFTGTIIPVHTDVSALDNALDEFIGLMGNGVNVIKLLGNESYEF